MKIGKYIILLMLCMIGYAYADLLSPDKAFHFSGKIEKNSIMIYGSTEPEYLLYKDSIKIINNKSTVQLQEVIKPQGKRQYNEFLKKYQEEYEGDFLLEIPFKGTGLIEFDIESQGCTKGLCYSPFLTHIKFQACTKGLCYSPFITHTK